MVHRRCAETAGVIVRGVDAAGGSRFGPVDLVVRIPPRHPLRKIGAVVRDALASLDADFETLCADVGRPSIAPERLIRAGLAPVPVSVRSERPVPGQRDDTLLFRSFARLGIDDPVWVLPVFAKNRDRLRATAMSQHR